MTAEAVKAELESIVQQVRAHEWTPELFDRCRALLGHADVFNVLRRRMPLEEYERFDLAYCSHIRPQDKELNEYLIKERQVREWRTMKSRDLQKLSDRKLLKLLRTLNEENKL